MELELTGMQELLAKLEASRVRMAGPEMTIALKEGAKVIQQAMTERAPVLDHRTPGSTALEPGALQKGIKVRMHVGPAGAEALIGPTGEVAHVARFVEYGHRMVHGGQSKVVDAAGHTRGSGTAGEDVPPHPFLRPAFEASVAEAGEVMALSLKQSLREVLK